MAVIDNILRSFGLASANTLQKKENELTEIRSGTVNPDQWLMDFFTGGLSGAGSIVNEKTILSISAAYACIRIRSSAIASLPLLLYRRLPNGDIEEVRDIPEYQIACLEPHNLYTKYTYDSTTMLHESVRGNAYTLLTFGRYGRIAKMKILNGTVTPYLKDDRVWYKHTDEYGKQDVYADYEILHDKNFSSDGILGKSPIEVARDTFGMPIAANEYASSIYKNGGYVKGIIETQQGLKDTQLAQLRSSFMSVLQDYKSTSGIAILGNGMTYKQMSMSPKDTEFIAASRMSVLDICRIYGVPPHMVAELDRATFSNIEQQSIEYLMHSLRPILTNREAERNRRILRQSDKGTYFYKYDTNELLRGDSAARAAFISTMLMNGVYSIDEARQLDGKNQLPNELGKAHYRPLNMVEIGKEADPALLNNDPATGITDIGNGTPQAAA